MTDRIRSSEGVASVAALVAAMAMIAQHVAGRATRDALFLSNFDIDALPLMMSAAALISLPVLLVTSHALLHKAPARVVPAVFAASVAMFVAEWGVSLFEPHSASVLVYLHLAVLGPIAISGFWLLVNERFDPHTAKKQISRIAAAATLGGIAGGLLTERVAAHLTARDMLLFLTALNFVGLVGVRRLAVSLKERTSDTGTVDPESLNAAFQESARNPYLRQLAGLTAVVAMSSAIFDYVLRAEATAIYPTEHELLRFFALFYMTTSVLAFAVQAFAGHRVLARLGIAGTVTLLPVLLLAGGVVGAALSSIFHLPLWRVAALRGADAVMQNSLFRSGYELLYTPLSRMRRRPTKTIIDVGFDRIGQIAGSALVVGIVALLPLNASTALLATALVGAAVTLGITLRLHTGYVRALEDSLRRGSLELGETELVDPTTRTVWESSVSLSRAQILRAIAASEAEERHGGLDDAGVTHSVRPNVPVVDPVLTAIADLRSGDLERVRRQLITAQPLDPVLVSQVIPLLEDDAIQHEASRALRVVADRAAGQLLDALLDPTTSFTIRRRLPRVLKGCTTRRVVAGLMQGLRDRQFDVRHHCARALVAITTRDPTLRPAPEEVFAAARREVEVGRSVWNSQELCEDLDDGIDDVLRRQANDLIRRRTNLSLEHVFTILALVLDREPLELAFKAVRGGRGRARGTALEYLENVLPQNIRDALWPYLGMSTMTRASSGEIRKATPTLGSPTEESPEPPVLSPGRGDG